MMYDSLGFERQTLNAELRYLAQDFSAKEEEAHKCSGFCQNEATTCIDGLWYCDECAEEVRKMITD